MNGAWGLEALELKAWMVILGTKIGENSDTHKLIGELGGLKTWYNLLGNAVILPQAPRLKHSLK